MSTKPLDYLSMSDEELLNAAPPSAQAASEDVTDQTEAGDDAAVPDEVAAQDAGDAAGADDTADQDEADEKAEGDEGGEAEGGTPEADAKPEVTEKNKKKEGEDEKPAPSDAQVTDFEAEYRKLLAPFKANGRELQVQNVDEAVALMQMGANYNKKMAALKPNLKLLKMLEKAELLTEDRISFLIDLNRKDPAAINKLVNDSGIDPLDLSAEKAKAYKQSSYAVDDREVELDTVLDELQDSATYTQTLEVVSNKWDPASKQLVAQQPQLLRVLDDHMASGVYGLISTEVERQRMFGRLNGLSDIQAYRHVGDEIQARGGFDHLFKQQAATKPATQEPVVVKPAPKADTSKRDERRRAASTTTPSTTAAQPAQDFNPLGLSDAEFEKLINKRLA